jgi:polysaccharide pyruvyl transferase WcaK-like protein
MKTILLSTSSLWNCGDDFIREGLLELLNLKPDIRTLWWNRGYGISCSYANDLRINLSNTDYFIMAGTPQWIFRNEIIYEFCLKKSIPMSIIGIGTRGLVNSRHHRLMKHVANSGLCELALARDETALNTLKELGFKNAELMLDPAFFMKPLTVTERKVNILGWRYQFGGDYDPTFPYGHPLKFLRMQQIAWVKRRERNKTRAEYNKYMINLFASMPESKKVIVHDNREIKEAENIFGKEHIFYSSDYRDIFKHYVSAKNYVGSRLHGAIPAMIHGASVHLVYSDTRWKALKAAMSILSPYIEGIEKKIKITLCTENRFYRQYKPLESLDTIEIQTALRQEKKKIRSLFQSQKILSEFIS